VREGRIGYFEHPRGREREGCVFINPSGGIKEGRIDFQKQVREGFERAYLNFQKSCSY